MQILLLVILAYLFLPVLGELFLLLTGSTIVAGNVTWQLFISNLIYSCTTYFIISLFYAFTHNKYYKLGFLPSNKDHRTIQRISVIITILCLLVFYFSGYDYLIKGENRGDIRVSFGAFGFLYKWITIYAIPILLFTTTLLMLINKNISKKIVIYIYTIGSISAIFTGYKYVIIFSFIPVSILILFNKSIVKTLLLTIPIVLTILTLTTKLVMGYSFLEAFYFLIHRMTVMTAFGVIGVWNHYPDGVQISDSIKLMYSIFGNNINKILFDIDPNSIEVLDINLSRKITYLVYPSWERALSGSTNVTVSNFGEAIYIFGKWYIIYAIFCGILFGFFIRKIMIALSKGKLILVNLLLIYVLSTMLSWLNSTTIFSLISFPTIAYITMSYIMLFLLLKSKV